MFSTDAGKEMICLVLTLGRADMFGRSSDVGKEDWWCLVLILRRKDVFDIDAKQKRMFGNGGRKSRYVLYRRLTR